MTAETRRSLPLAPEPAAPPIDALEEELLLLEHPDDEEAAERALRLVLAAVVRLGPGRVIEADAGEAHYLRGDVVVVDVDGELHVTEVVSPSRRVMRRASRSSAEGDAPLPRVLRRAAFDPASARELRRREVALEQRAREEARTLDLPVRVVRAETVPGSGKVVLSFASDEKVIFRDWLRALTASPELAALDLRLELRQIGLRDAARLAGGVGPCGLTLCCHTFLADTPELTVKMAQGQALGTSPARISGVCGKLLCCLSYEEAFYRAQRARLPSIGETVGTPRGLGVVERVDVLAGRVLVVCEHGDESFSIDAIERSHGAPASIRPGR